MTLFRPCIDLHEGKVKQIVGGSLTDDGSRLKTNFASEQPAGNFAALYQKDGLSGGHIILLGKGNDTAAREALEAYPDGLQVGGGIHIGNAEDWLKAGASHVIVTSGLFDASGRFRRNQLVELSKRVGRERLVVDLSCRRNSSDGWVVAMNRWQALTDLKVEQSTIDLFQEYAAEFLIHAADVEGKCEGIDEALVSHLAAIVSIPTTYAGGVRSIDDLDRVNQLSNGRIDLTIGSALDIFGGALIRYEDCVRWNRSQAV